MAATTIRSPRYPSTLRRRRARPTSRWEFPFGVAVNSDGTRAYVTNRFSSTVSVIDTTTNQRIADIPVGIQPQGWR